MAVESAIQLMLSFGILIVAILTLAHNFTNKKSKNAPDSYILAFPLIN
ncbi:putative holin-like toxin [Bacillus amyloliquefaciens]